MTEETKSSRKAYSPEPTVIKSYSFKDRLESRPLYVSTIGFVFLCSACSIAVAS